MKQSDVPKIVSAVLVSVLVVAALVVASLAHWDAADVSRVVMAGIAGLLLLVGVFPRGPGAGGAAAAAVIVFGEVSSALVRIAEGVP